MSMTDVELPPKVSPMVSVVRTTVEVFSSVVVRGPTTSLRRCRVAEVTVDLTMSRP